MIGKITTFIYFWFPPLLLCAVIFAFSATPNMVISTGTNDFILRKLVHMFEFGLLAVLFYRAISRGTRFTLRTIFLTRTFWLAFLLTLLYAASDEYHQTFVATRVGNPTDFFIDSVGMIIGIVLYIGVISSSWGRKWKSFLFH